MKLGLKLTLAPALTALVMLVVGQVESALMFQAADKSLAGFANQVEQFKTINDVQDQLADIHTDVYRTMAGISTMDDTQVASSRAGLAQQLKGAERVIDILSTDGLDAASLDKAHQLTQRYQKDVDAALSAAKASPETARVALKAADDTFEALKQHYVGLVSKVDDFHAAQFEADRRNSTQLHWLFSALALAVALAAVWASWLAIRRVVAELARASQLTQEVAKGNLHVPVVTDREDEVGDLMRALSAMQTALNQVVSEICKASEQIAVSGAQIASGTQDLASRTESAASSLEVTASSMEALTATVRQSAEAAAQANQLATSAAGVATKGGEVVHRVVSTMEDINQSSRKIADIIGVIDSIAFQTNILALNAAVEAARAGEAGRGFAVVASEVRSLAGRSAQAAKEIKHLINASVEKVQSGTQQVEDAGNTMGEIVASVQRVTDVIAAITSAAESQSQGIGQVNLAVNQLDQTTQQNAALVEESSAAATSLKEQATRLTQAVSVFTTPA